MHEKIVLLAEADYISTQWYQDTLSGILSQIKRYDMDFRVISHIPQEPVEEYQNGFVLLFGMSAAWMGQRICGAGRSWKRGRHKSESQGSAAGRSHGFHRPHSGNF